MNRTEPTFAKYESKGTWFEARRSYPRVPIVGCPVCEARAFTLAGTGKVRVMSYVEAYDKQTRSVVAKIEAHCMCGTTFSIEKTVTG